MINQLKIDSLATRLTTWLRGLFLLLLFFFLRLGSVDGGLPLLLLFNEKRSANKVMKELKKPKDSVP